MLRDATDTLGTFFSSSSFWTPDWIPEISAWLEHAPFAFWLMETHRPAVEVELGTHWGYSQMAFCQAVHTHQIPCTCYAVDTWLGDKHAGYYGNEVYNRLDAYNQVKYSAFSTLIRSSFDDAVQYFADGTIDLLHIDGLHTYDAARKDFETWLPKLSRRAVVMLHDINVREREFGIWQFWQELSARHPHFAFNHGYGLGILGVGSEIGPTLKSLFDLAPESILAGLIRQRYSRLGTGITGMKVVRENTKMVEEMQRLGGLQLQVNELQEANASLHAQKTQLDQQVESYLAEITRSNSEITLFQNRINEAENQGLAQHAEIQGLLDEKGRLQSRANELGQELEKHKVISQEKFASQAAELEHFFAKVSSLEDTNAEFSQQVAGLEPLKIERDRVVREQRKLRTRIAELEQNLEDLQREAALAKDDLVHQIQIADKKSKAVLLTAESLRERNQQQLKLIKSAQNWQKRSWMKRAFHRWRVPNDKAEKLASLQSKKLTKNLRANGDGGEAEDKTRVLLQSIFHEGYYAQQLAANEAKVPDGLEHYRTTGWRTGLKPHPYFDVDWYLQQYPDVGEAGVDPLEHYLKYGWREERNPHPFFDVAWYLKQNADIQNAGMEPLGHYLEWGWKEGGRMPSPFGDGDWFVEFLRQGEKQDEYEIRKSFPAGIEEQLARLNPAKPSILMVTHDATRTGAPTIALNLIWELRNTYNVITFSLGSGSLDESFESASDVFVGAPSKSYPNVRKAGLYIQFLIEHCTFEFALVNSIESISVLPTLARNDIPTVHLVHEFAGYSRPTDKMRQAAFLSSATVFPATIVHENAASVCEEFVGRTPLIVPQGYCLCPASEKSKVEMLQEQKAIKTALRPDGWEDAVVVLGIGTVQMRKGVDLFFLCAEDVIKNNPGRKVRFVWAGPGYDPEKDIHFSVYLADQLQRMAADDAACLIGEISQPQYAYDLADIFLLAQGWIRFRWWRKRPCEMLCQ